MRSKSACLSHGDDVDGATEAQALHLAASTAVNFFTSRWVLVFLGVSVWSCVTSK